MLRAYIGLLGQGKTLNMVYDLIQEMIAGRRVITNTPIAFRHKGKTFRAEFVDDGKEFERMIKKEEDCIFGIDEAAIMFPSYYWKNLPMSYILKLAQARKYKTDFFYTSQGYNHTISRLRDLTNEVVKCRQFPAPLPFWIFNKPIFQAITYDPEFFDKQIMDEKMEKRFIIKRKILFYNDYKIVFDAYDTMYRVNHSALGNVDD